MTADGEFIFLLIVSNSIRMKTGHSHTLFAFSLTLILLLFDPNAGQVNTDPSSPGTETMSPRELLDLAWGMSVCLLWIDCLRVTILLVCSVKPRILCPFILTTPPTATICSRSGRICTYFTLEFHGNSILIKIEFIITSPTKLFLLGIRRNIIHQALSCVTICGHSLDHKIYSRGQLLKRLSNRS
ncbi:hypothetical protein CRM22_003380 [Opisthorchis felineus]|uniref:Uncharacterized protein n=1 Tax=Opisthorchis felineus TaxID=147828 RepID=A0A4V3SFW7_OPIFE|nr:hypothetical protein CRM22_003380 [Opisthorchis felineus]